MKRLVLAIGLLLLATACPKIERKVYTFDLKSGTGSVRFVNLTTDDPAKANDDFMEVVNKMLLGTQLEEENPGWRIVSKELVEQDGRLDGVVHFTFDAPADIGVYRHDKRSPLIWCAAAANSETLVATNGKRIDDVLPGCVAWERKATQLEVTVREGAMMGTEASLLPQYRKWKAGEELPLAGTGSPLLGGGDPTAMSEELAGQLMSSIGGAMGLSGSMTPGTPVVEGPMDPAAFSASMARVRDAKLTFCYQAARTTTPELQGPAELTLSIGADGALGEVVVSRSLGDEVLDACMKDALSDATFPAPGAPTTVRYPVTFSPE